MGEDEEMSNSQIPCSVLMVDPKGNFEPTRPVVLTMDDHRMGRALLSPKDGSASIPVKTVWAKITFQECERDIVGILKNVYDLEISVND